MTKRHILGIISICLCVIIAVLTTLTVDATIRIEGDPGARMFPYMTAILFGATGLVFLLGKTEEEEKVFLTSEQWKRLFELFLVLCAYIAMIWAAGFNIATAVMLFVVSSMFARGQSVPVQQRLLYALLSTVVIYIIFKFGLKIYLPKGLLNLI